MSFRSPTSKIYANSADTNALAQTGGGFTPDPARLTLSSSAILQTGRVVTINISGTLPIALDALPAPTVVGTLSVVDLPPVAQVGHAVVTNDGGNGSAYVLPTGEVTLQGDPVVFAAAVPVSFSVTYIL